MRLTLCPEDVQIGQVAVALVQVEAIPHEQLVGHSEADVPHRKILDEAPVRAIEQGHHRKRSGVAQRECAREIVQREAGVDHVLDDEDVASGDLRLEVLQEADACVPAGVGVRGVCRQLDEVERMGNGDRARKVGEEDEARLQRRDEEGVSALVVAGDFTPELAHARLQLLTAEVNLPEPPGLGYDASSSWYRWAKRSMSRL